MSKKVEVADQKTADAFIALGIDAVVKGAAAPAGSEDLTLVKGQLVELQKSFDAQALELIEAKQTIEKGGIAPSADGLTKAHVDALALINKSVLEAVSGLDGIVKGFIESVNEKLESIETEVQTIGTAEVGRRTIKDTKVIQKAFELEEKTGKKILSKSHNAKEIIGLLDGLADNAETAEMYGDATVRFETARVMTKAVELDLLNNHDIKIVD